jgi:hypothetical protein
MTRVRIEGATIVPITPTVAAGHAFCSVCGGLFKLQDNVLPIHVSVGRGTTMCTGGIPVYEGEVSP